MNVRSGHESGSLETIAIIDGLVEKSKLLRCHLSGLDMGRAFPAILLEFVLQKMFTESTLGTACVLPIDIFRAMQHAYSENLDPNIWRLCTYS